MSERQNFAGSSPYEPVIGFSRAVRVGAACDGVGDGGRWDADDADIAGQTDQCLTLIAAALKQAGTSFEHVVRTRMYLTSRDDWEAAGRVHGKFFKLVMPAATMVIVAGLIDPRWKVEIEVDALIVE